MPDEYSISQLTEDESAADSDLIEVAKDNGDGTFTSRKQLRSTLLADKAAQADLDAHEADTANPHSVTAAQVGAPTTADLTAHTSNTSNPHSVTRAQVGLSNADNTSDASKPVSTATQSALADKADADHSHTAGDITDFDTEVANNAAVTANTAKNSYPSADATKLAGIEAGAEVNEIGTADIANFETTTELNSRDTANRSRTNHTGSHAIGTVTGLQDELDGKSDTGHTHDDRYYTETETDTALVLKADATDVPATIVESVVAGTNVTVDNTDPANPVVSASGGGEGGGAVDSVNGETGVVVLDQDDIADGTTAKQYTATEKTKLAGIETAATADQTGAEIKTAYEAEADTNAFTDADHTKLDGIASGATANSSDATLLNRTNHTGTQTASTISDFDTEGSNNTDVAANTADRHSHANSAVLDATTASCTTADETKLDGIETGAEVNVSEINDSATTTTNTWSADKISTEVSAGGGGGGEQVPYDSYNISANAASVFLEAGNQFTEGSGSVSLDNGIHFQTTTASSSAATALFSPTSWNYFNYDYTLSMQVRNNTSSGTGLWFVGNIGLIAGGSAKPNLGNSHCGFYNDYAGGTPTSYASTAFLGTQTATSFTPNSSTHVMTYGLAQTTDSVKFYQNGELIATITENLNVQIDDMRALTTNSGSSSNIQFRLISMNLSRRWG